MRRQLSDVVVEAVRRAAPGTVRPAIIAALEQHSHGLSASKLASWTNLTENTIRGTLRAMRLDGIVEKRGELWFLSRKNEAADAIAGEHSSTASVHNPAQGREAGPEVGYEKIDPLIKRKAAGESRSPSTVAA